ncbi:MAG: hypothetical protein K2Y33_04730 [Mycolicibacterium frederiksbergense]|nr:hypothetical protein [Mycolicibacterium frederiksbergense]
MVVTVEPPLIAAPAPVTIPPGSVLHTRGVDQYTGAWHDTWYLPYEGQHALTEQGVIDFLQAELPGGQPYREAPGSQLDWCRGADGYWSWQKPGDGPDQPDVIDRLAVRLIDSHILDIQRDADKPLDCLS